MTQIDADSGREFFICVICGQRPFPSEINLKRPGEKSGE
jgi:hypothetical protein